MPRAIFNGTVVAESDATIVVEGNHYFPPAAIKPEYFEESSERTVCHWKGTAAYYDVVVGDATARAAAWYYPDTSDRAKQIENWVAFWRGVTVEG